MPFGPLCSKESWRGESVGSLDGYSEILGDVVRFRARICLSRCHNTLRSVPSLSGKFDFFAKPGLGHFQKKGRGFTLDLSPAILSNIDQSLAFEVPCTWIVDFAQANGVEAADVIMLNTFFILLGINFRRSSHGTII